MKIHELHLPEGIIKAVNKKNWKRLWDNYMVFREDYVWHPNITKKFISKIIKTNDTRRKTRRTG